MNAENNKSFEKTIAVTLKGASQERALDFATFLKANGMEAGGENGAVNYKGNPVAYIHMDGMPEMPGPWTVWPEGDFSVVPDGFSFDEALKETAWSNINKCGDCGSNCAPGSRKVIFGREFNNICNSVMAFNDPDDNALACLKKLLEMKLCTL